MDDSALSLNTGSEAEAIQAHHSFWLFPPDSQDLKRGWEAKSHPGQVACHPVPVTSAQPAPAGATILKEPATSGQPDWLLSHPNKIQRARDSLASPHPTHGRTQIHFISLMLEEASESPRFESLLRSVPAEGPSWYPASLNQKGGPSSPGS